MYREERERRRFEDEFRRQHIASHQAADVEMANAGIDIDAIAEDEGSNWELSGEVQEIPEDAGGETEEIDEEL